MELTPAAAGGDDLADGVFRRIVDLTGNPFVIAGPEGTIRYAGASVDTVLGWPPAELVGRNVLDLLPADQVDIAVAGLAEVSTLNRSADGLPIVFHVLRRDGTTVPVEVAALPVLDLPGGDGIALRLRIWESEHHFDGFLAAMLDGLPLDTLLGHLCRSIAAGTDSAAAAVHHGFDGRAFGATSSWNLPMDFSEGVRSDQLPTDVPAVFGVDDLPPAARRAAAAAGLRACWTTPVPAFPGVAPAVLSVWRRTDGPPLLGHRHVLERSGRYVQLALVRTAEHQRLEHLAGHDALTGVANRAQFRDRLAEALAIGERHLAVAFCDLDRFKPVNDTFGHLAGDAVLVEVAARLRKALRAGDELARLGGDEFTVLLRNVTDEASARLVADRLLDAVRDPFPLPNGDRVRIGLSVGIALWSEGDTADGLLAQADEALYASKRTGGGASRITGVTG